MQVPEPDIHYFCDLNLDVLMFYLGCMVILRKLVFHKKNCFAESLKAMSKGNPLQLVSLISLSGICLLDIVHALPSLQQLGTNAYKENSNALERPSYENINQDQILLPYLLQSNSVERGDNSILSGVNRLSSFTHPESSSMKLSEYLEDNKPNAVNQKRNWDDREFGSGWQDQMNFQDADVSYHSDLQSSTKQEEDAPTDCSLHLSDPSDEEDLLQEFETLQNTQEYDKNPIGQEEDSDSDLISKLLQVLFDKHDELSKIDKESLWWNKRSEMSDFGTDVVRSKSAPTNLRDTNGYIDQRFSGNLDAVIPQIRGTVNNNHVFQNQHRLSENSFNSLSMFPFYPKDMRIEPSYESSDISMDFSPKPQVNFGLSQPSSYNGPSWSIPDPYMERSHDIYGGPTNSMALMQQQMEASVLPTFPHPPPPPTPLDDPIFPLPFFGSPLPPIRHLPFSEPFPSMPVAMRNLPPFMHELSPPLHPASYLYPEPPLLPLNLLPPQSGSFQPIHPTPRDSPFYIQAFIPRPFENDLIPWNLPALRLLFRPPPFPHHILQERYQSNSIPQHPRYPPPNEQLHMGMPKPWHSPHPIQMPQSYHVTENPSRFHDLHLRIIAPYAPYTWNGLDPRVMPGEFLQSFTGTFSPRPNHF